MPTTLVPTTRPRDIGEHYTPPTTGWRWIKNRIRGATNLTGMLGISLATAGHAWFTAPFDVEFNEIPMPLRDLHPDLVGLRLLQITDLHAGKRTPLPYLRSVVARVNEMPKDLVCITGDLVTSSLRWVKPVCDLLAQLKGRVIVTLGNHDYSQQGNPWNSAEVAAALENELVSRGIEVLRDRAIPIDRGNGRFWIVGMEDYWFPQYSPDRAFAQITTNDPIVALSHNPDTAVAMIRRGAQWVIAGHTHGGQIRLPVLGSMILPVQDKRHDQGLFRLDNAYLYVSRGVGAKLRVRFRCRPEVTTFVLQQAARSA